MAEGLTADSTIWAWVVRRRGRRWGAASLSKAAGGAARQIRSRVVWRRVSAWAANQARASAQSFGIGALGGASRLSYREFVVQFVQQFHADDFTVGPSAPRPAGRVQAMGLEQHAPAVDVVRVQRGRMPRLATPGRGVPTDRAPAPQDAAGGRFPVCKAQVEGAKSHRPGLRWRQVAAQLCVRAPRGLRWRRGGPAVGPRLHAPAPSAARTCWSWKRAGRAPRSSSCAPRQSPGPAGGVQHGVVAGALFAKAEIVAHQHISARPGRITSTASMKACGD